jgi:hypothetical protein
MIKIQISESSADLVQVCMQSGTEQFSAQPPDGYLEFLSKLFEVFQHF